MGPTSPALADTRPRARPRGIAKGDTSIWTVRSWARATEGRRIVSRGGGGPQLVVSCLPLSHAIGLLHPPDGWLTGGAIAPFVGRVLVVGWKQISERDQINHHGHT